MSATDIGMPYILKVFKTAEQPNCLCIIFMSMPVISPFYQIKFARTWVCVLWTPCKFIIVSINIVHCTKPCLLVFMSFSWTFELLFFSGFVFFSWWEGRYSLAWRTGNQKKSWNALRLNLNYYCEHQYSALYKALSSDFYVLFMDIWVVFFRGSFFFPGGRVGIPLPEGREKKSWNALRLNLNC